MVKNRNSESEKQESRHFLKRISAKLIIAVLVAVILPFGGLIVFIDSQIETRLKENIVRRSLLSLATDLAEELNSVVRDCNGEAQFLATNILARKTMEEHLYGQKSGQKWKPKQEDMFNQLVNIRQIYDLILLIDRQGRLVVCSSINGSGQTLDPEMLNRLYDQDFTSRKWFRQAVKKKLFRVNQHKNRLLPVLFEKNPELASQYQIGFAASIPSTEPGQPPLGIVYSLVNWQHIQKIIDVPSVKAYFSGLVKDKEPSPYAWIWGADGNTIMAHKDRTLYGAKITGERVNLPQMVEDALSARSGYYREYEFRGKKKNAAFHHCNGPEMAGVQGGFGWIVGVGIDNEDIFAMSGKLSSLLYKSAMSVIFIVMVWIFFVARRTTRPVLKLQRHMRSVSNGDLRTIESIKSGDEINDLADDFNHMILDLKDKRAKLIKAEKDAAWREMAQQISHDIKNTITPIKLSVDLLKDSSKKYGDDQKEILMKPLDLIDSQIRSLEEIALDFFEFTGGRKPIISKCNIAQSISHVFEIYRKWAEEHGISFVGIRELTDQNINILADNMKLHRMLSNIISNSIHAMPNGGVLSVQIDNDEDFFILKIRDSGVGISEDVKQHLFEPYFTTRSQGTGLGLAIAKRVMEDTGGKIEIRGVNGKSGTGTEVLLYFPRSSIVSGLETDNESQ